MQPGIYPRKADQNCVYLKGPNFLHEPNLHVALAEIGVTDPTIRNCNTHIVFIGCACNVSSTVGNGKLHTETKIVRSIDNHKMFITNDNHDVTGGIDIDEDSSLPKYI